MFSKPQDRLFAGQIDRMDRFVALFARVIFQRTVPLPYSGLRGQRTSLIRISSTSLTTLVAATRRASCWLTKWVSGETIEAG
ncbi:hypothetical protein ACLK19_00415 [Escherichia coli]